jgi:hypothetical protein
MAKVDWVPPFYDVADSGEYHTSPDCSVGAAIPEGRRRLAVAVMRERLPGW